MKTHLISMGKVLCDKKIKPTGKNSTDNIRGVDCVVCLSKAKKIHIHGCGHPVRPVIMCDDPFCLIMSEWFDWNEEHDEAKEGECVCYFCWKEREEKKDAKR